MTDLPFAPDLGFGILRLPAQVSFGVGAVQSLPREVAALGTRVFVCVDPFIATTPAFATAVEGMSALGLVVAVYTEVVPELPTPSVEAAAAVARTFGPDVVVGFGGGSAIDLAKLVALLASQPGELSSFYGENNVPLAVLPLVAVPTTAGTGSEVTPVAVITDPARELKVGISSPRIIPTVAIVDPTLTIGAPAAVTAFSGIDAFVHAVESFTAAHRQPAWDSTMPVFVGRNALCSMLALEAIRLIGSSLRTAVKDPGNVPARERMAYGSMLAGMAFGSAGTHLSHAIQYPVGALTHTAHGLGTGMLLPYVLQACLPETRAELIEIAGALGLADVADPAQAAIDEIAALVTDIGIPSTLAEIGLDRDQLPRIAELAAGVTRLAGNATIEPTREAIEAILESAFTGDRTPAPQR